MVLNAATKNKGKLEEFLSASVESGLTDLKIVPLPFLGEIEPPEETGTTFEENAAIKARYYSGFADGFVFADDSGLEVDALGGAPGVYSARYAGAGATDADNNRFLLRNLDETRERTARFVCVIALARSGKVLLTASGAVEGEILREYRGDGGFGYDPLFFCRELGCTFAEVGHEQKFQLSHRGRAFRQLLREIARCGLDREAP